MAVVERQSAVVFYAPTPRRRYLSLRGAVYAEARARMNLKYPSEAPQEDEYGITDRGWHWRDDPILCRIFDRYEKLLRRATLATSPADMETKP